MIDLQALSVWCHRRHVTWAATGRHGSHLALVLEPHDASLLWQRMRLVVDEPAFHLEDEEGETLASASTLPALLDAVDAGVADTLLSHPRRAQCA